MASPFVTRTIARGAGRLPWLRRLPMYRLIALAEIAVLARTHLTKLSPVERRRLLELVRAGRGRRGNLLAEEREELATLVAKMEPREFAGRAAQRLAPVPLPGRFGGGR